MNTTATDKISPTNVEMATTSTSPAKSPQQNILLNDNPPTTVSNKKVVTIASPSTTEKQPTPVQNVNLVNQSESGNSKSSFTKFKVRTCCGVVEFTAMKLACVIGMLVTVIGLLVLAGVAIGAFITVSSKSTEVLISVSQVTSLFESSNALVIKFVFTGTPNMMNEALTKYRNASQTMLNIVRDIQLTLNDPYINSLLNSTTIDASNRLLSQSNQIMLYINTGQQYMSIERLNSEDYIRNMNIFKDGLDSIVSYVQEKEREKDNNILAITLVQLIVIAVSLFVILPIIVFVFMFAINRDSLYLEKIRRANAVMLMDTMEDESLRALFRTHCEKEKSIENFLLLEKIQHYRSLCERSIELQMRMFGNDSNNFSDVSSDISAESASSSKKKKESPLEKEYNEVEAKKYEVAFEIFTDFLEVTGEMAVNVSHLLTDTVKDQLDKFNDKQIETLAENMFDVLEKQTCLVMMDTHHRFKQSLAFQREMKIDKIKVDKLKKKKADF